MGGQSLVLNPVFPVACEVPSSQVLRKAKDLIEKLRNSLMSSVSLDEKVDRVIEETKEFVARYTGRRIVKPTLEVVIAKTTWEWAEARAIGYEFPTKKYKSKEDFIQKCLADPKKGTYDNNFSRLILNLGAIHKAHEKDPRAEDACLVATTVHELLHHLGGFERFHRMEKHSYDLLWLIDGVNELLTRDVINHVYAEHSRNLTCQSCSTETALVMKLGNIVGHETLAASYFEGNFFPVRMKMREEGVSELDIHKMLQLGHQMVNAPESKKPAIVKELDAHLDKLDERRRTRRELEERPTAPGMSKTSIDVIKARLPKNEEETASRLALGACLYHKLQLNREPTAKEVADLVEQTYERSNCIVAETLNVLYALATATMGTASDAQPQLGTARPNYGDKIDYPTIALVEATAVNYMLKNDGALPDSNSVQQTVANASETIQSRDAITPSVQILTTEILNQTSSLLQDTHLTAEDSWVNGPAVAYSHGVVPRTEELFAQPYSETTAGQLAGVLNQTQEFAGVGTVMADSCAGYFAEIGVSPTCGEVFGLAATVAQVVTENRLDAIYETSKLPYTLVTPTLQASLSFMNGLRSETRAEVLNEVSSLPAVSVAQDGLWDYLQHKGFEPKAQEQVLAAAGLYVSLLRVERPNDRVRLDSKSGIVTISPDGRVVRADQIDFVNSQGVIGSTNIQGADDTKKQLQVPEHLLSVRPSALEYTHAEVGNLPPYAQAIADNIRAEYSDPYERAQALFEILKSDGKLGIKGNMFVDDRKDGSHSVSDVFRLKEANCLELTLTYLAMSKVVFADRNEVLVFGLDVANIQQRTEVGHACVGILTTDPRVQGHPAFNTDLKTRRKMLESLGIEDRHDLKLLVVDPVNALFDYQFHRVRYLSDAMAQSYFHTNSGIYAKGRGDNAGAERHYAEAERLWDRNPTLIGHKIRTTLPTEPGGCLELLAQVDEEDRNARFYHHLGVVHSALGNKAAALDAFGKAYQMDAFDQDVLYEYATHLACSGNRQGLERAEKLLEGSVRVLRTKRKDLGTSQRTARLKSKMLDACLAEKAEGVTQTQLMWHYHLLILVRIAQGKYAKAHEAAMTAEALEEQNTFTKELKAIAMIGRAGKSFNLGQNDKGNEQLSAAAEICNQELRSAFQGSGHANIYAHATLLFIARYFTSKEPRIPLIAEDEYMKGKKVRVNISLFDWGEIIMVNPDIITPGLKRFMGRKKLTCEEFLDFYLSVRTNSELRFNGLANEGARPVVPERLVSIAGLVTPATDRGGKIRGNAFRKVLEKKQKKATNVQRINALRGLGKREKAWLCGISSEMVIDSEAAAFVVVNHQDIMAKRRMQPGRAYHSKLAVFHSDPRWPNLVDAAKAALGPVFDDECRTFKELLTTDPSAIDRGRVRQASKHFIRYSAAEIDELTRKYLVNVGMTPTKERIAKTRSSVEQLLAAEPTISLKVGGIDTQYIQL